jgi:hypothetical protein
VLQSSNMFRIKEHPDSNSNKHMNVLKPAAGTPTNSHTTCSPLISSGRGGDDQMFSVQQILALKRSCAFPTSSSSATPTNNCADNPDTIAIAAARKMTIQLQWVAAFAENNDTTTTTKDALSDYDYYSDDDDDSGNEDYTTSDDEEETVVAKAIVKAAFTRRLSAPDFAKLKGRNDIADNAIRDPASEGGEPSAKRARLESFPVERVDGRLPMADSVPVLRRHVSNNATDPSTTASHNNKKNFMKPDDCLRALLTQHGASTKTFSALETNDFFLPVTAASIEAYDMQVVKAVRNSDVAALRELLKSGRSLQCGNKFGESIVHACCRRGSLTVLQFLFQEASVSCRVTCDYGRTPFHDACWTSDEPNFQLIDFLLAACPDLLHVKDARGFLPLAYVRQEHWDDWCRYLKSKNVEQLIARELV